MCAERPSFQNRHSLRGGSHRNKSSRPSGSLTTRRKSESIFTSCRLHDFRHVHGTRPARAGRFQVVDALRVAAPELPAANQERLLIEQPPTLKDALVDASHAASSVCVSIACRCATCSSTARMLSTVIY